MKNNSEHTEHFALAYARQVNEILHQMLWPTWFYRYEIWECPGVVTGVFVRYDEQEEDNYHVVSPVDVDRFLKRLVEIKADWATLEKDVLESLAQHPEKTIGGWESRTIYFFKGGQNPSFWTAETALRDTSVLLTSSALFWGRLVREELLHIREAIPPGLDHCKDYEHQVRVTINFLFHGQLSPAKPQVRTEVLDEGLEIRDLLCQNLADSGFWKDLKEKYSCSEILFDAKNTDELNRDDLRQIYCYLKLAIGFWGFLVCRAAQPQRIHAYNKTLFNNFGQSRGVTILTDDDLLKMVDMKLRGQDPSFIVRNKYSEFIRGV
jgi:hypothetical protein